MTRIRHFGWAVALVAAVSLVAGACGSDSNKTSASTAATADGGSATTSAAAGGGCAKGTISGAGSTFVQNIAQQWIKDYGTSCAGATVNYQGVGSGAGIQQFIAGTVDFGGTDAVMKPDEQTAATTKGGPVLHIPWSGGGVAIEYNLAVKNLKLSSDTLAAIFAGKITKWDDAKIKADNAGANLPSTTISVVHRSDGSGTTNALTSYLSAVAPTVWTFGSGKEVPWPAGQGAKGSDGVTAAVKQTQGAIGYAEVSFAKANSLGMALVKNSAGQFVGPTAEAVAAALGSATVPADLKIKPNFTTTDPAAYPISTPTWVIVFQKQADPTKGKVLKSFLSYALTTGQGSAAGLAYAPLPKALADKALAAVESIQA